MNIEAKIKAGAAPVVTYRDLLQQDSRPAPEIFAPATRDLGTAPISASRYTSPAFFQREVEKMWMRTWQFACRAREIPEPGDTHLYNLLGRQVIIVRQADKSIKAFMNVCRHRGRKLVDHAGCKVRYRCAYHGLTWRIDGTLEENPFAWDFPQLEGSDIPLLPVRCETWAGFVFVNFDPDAAPLLEQMAPMPEHFERWMIDRCYKSAHVAKIARANWKVCAEAFIEGHHVICTHPEYNLFSGYDSTQTDILSDHVTRFLSPVGLTPGPFLDRNIDDLKRVELMLAAGNRAFEKGQQVHLPDGATARSFSAANLRKMLEGVTGYDLRDTCDAEILDGIGYDFFPAFHLWGGFKPKISYRFRPIDHETTFFEVMLFTLAPKDADMPAEAKLRVLDEDQKWAEAPELGVLGPVYDQDYSNMRPMQEGLQSLGEQPIHFTKYLEARCRNLHRMIDEYMTH
ncbi:Rieske [2Fe-2S] domain-containing protein [Novosphingobium sp. CF614]|uniref:aromatic ring-hydroxylating oxygenase subunit alpha n=1 Tax=Novosphingobium sp. CF614 TaxID=1884364 RepID=UPI0008E565AE|nr:aromatic ring-hydroxylating dioxygenase subunit alpha [Novosphingobium sp. CF614]SFG00955.1 Rieske [2Fe-2S] domain-containing protein [Novosphingobium sp. CF614]